MDQASQVFSVLQKWPSSEAVRGFQDIHTTFFQRCKDLSLRVLRVIAQSLALDPDVFLHAHRFIGTDENGTTLRSLYYPPVKSEMAKEGQLRCGEHSDYGSITLLFQGSEGLQSIHSVQHMSMGYHALRVLAEATSNHAS
ncbi:hypothetical protein ATANTOWER_020383 [Ataeniobius toweri]|uniref:Uncharacterized protein n=1 Tax=Ataeniobius toweri TaxID=208326 RepID=A0ABU7B7S8_9TELE|nr:hypothetical protein [Ataeniobius toweri]